MSEQIALIKSFKHTGNLFTYYLIHVHIKIIYDSEPLVNKKIKFEWKLFQFGIYY